MTGDTSRGEDVARLRAWVVREDVVTAIIPRPSSDRVIPVMHRTDSGCLRGDVPGQVVDTATVQRLRREEVERFEATGERKVYFCEQCVIRLADSEPKFGATGGNPLCSTCFMHHAGDCY